MKIERFEEIRAWQLARQLTKEIYRISDGGDFARDFGLRDQIRRAAVSVMSNIAEGFDAGSDTEFVRFLRYATLSVLPARFRANFMSPVTSGMSQRPNSIESTG